jgi:hypothetical protein
MWLEVFALSGQEDVGRVRDNPAWSLKLHLFGVDTSSNSVQEESLLAPTASEAALTIRNQLQKQK